MFTWKKSSLDSYSFLKRSFDLIFSLGFLVIFSPLFLIIALLIKLSSKGPVFYRSQRVGLANKPISCLKFRTMYLDAENRLNTLLSQNPSLHQEWVQYQKIKQDPRILPIGRFLRKTSLDELPQFFNVLLGDLSVVGPRPFYEHQVKEYLGDKVDKFLSVKPGITGLWQVSGRNLLTFTERLVLEETYIDNLSFLKDCQIILKTLPAVISSKGAY
ncbi:MAG: sugar transferase [Chlamydiota bacterium]